MFPSYLPLQLQSHCSIHMHEIPENRDYKTIH